MYGLKAVPFRQSEFFRSLFKPLRYAFETVEVISFLYEFDHRRHPNSTLPTLPEARQKTAFDGKPRKGRYFRPLQLGGTTDLFHCVGAAQAANRRSFDEKQNVDLGRPRSLTAFGGCRQLRLRPGIQVKALHWPDQRLFTLKYEC
jgi:hypothetical protein